MESYAGSSRYGFGSFGEGQGPETTKARLGGRACLNLWKGVEARKLATPNLPRFPETVNSKTLFLRAGALGPSTAAARTGRPSHRDGHGASIRLTQDGLPLMTMARRVDGAFPSPINPIAIWEIKEYYYTTTFGSRVADGVYESLLDGMELEELDSRSEIRIKHYLIVDSAFTWWTCGKSYLCRIFDMLHMGYVDEVLFGREVVEELPRIVSEWIETYRSLEAAH